MKYGRYDTLRELGRGSMGIVHEAHDPQIDRTVALKVLRQDRHASDAFVKRFLKEARAIGRLSHPGIVTVYDVGEDNGTIYIAMEFLEGRPLSQVIEEKTFSLDEVLDLGIQMAETLDYAHGKGVIHRDIKPSNILVQSRGRIKITDFGIARIEDPGATLQTQEGEILGTPAYMSPEQILGRSIDGRSDLFSLGVILYELSTGKRPFGGRAQSLATVFNEISNTSPPEPATLNPSLDPGLSRVIMRCLAKDPRDRYPSGEALAEALRQCRETETVILAPLVAPAPSPATTEPLATAATRSPAPEPPPIAPSRPRPILLALVLTITVAASVPFLVPGGPRRVMDWLGKPDADPSAPRRVATLEAQSLPDGAELWIDGTLKGITPLQVRLGLGRYSVKAVAPGFEEWSSELELTEPVAVPLMIQLHRKAALATVKVESTPPDALVVIEGAARGKTPLTLELPPGAHRLVLTLENHEDWAGDIQVSAETEAVFKAELKPVAAVQTAVLKMETEPGGAEILVDGEVKGRTPAEIALPTGRYRLTARLEGHVDWSEEVDLKELRKYPLFVRLQPTVRDGKLMILTHPEGAEVFFNGERRGVTPFELRIQPGDHMVKLKLQGHEDWQQRFRIEAGKEYPVRVDLMPLPGESTLAITSTPSNASVFVDGTALGKTPVKLMLPPGAYKVRLKLKSYQDWETRVQLVEAREYPLNAMLTREEARTRSKTASQEPARRPSTPRTPPPEQPAPNDWGVGAYRDRRIHE
jgi:serine/threonine-protein kinase